MPLGSSSAAPFTRPGPRRLAHERSASSSTTSSGSNGSVGTVIPCWFAPSPQYGGGCRDIIARLSFTQQHYSCHQEITWSDGTVLLREVTSEAYSVVLMKQSRASSTQVVRKIKTSSTL